MEVCYRNSTLHLFRTKSTCLWHKMCQQTHITPTQEFNLKSFRGISLCSFFRHKIAHKFSTYHKDAKITGIYVYNPPSQAQILNVETILQQPIPPAWCALCIHGYLPISTFHPPCKKWDADPRNNARTYSGGSATITKKTCINNLILNLCDA